MLDFIWKYKYLFYTIIFLIFLYSLYLISNPKIFFDTERILKYADDIQIELKESFNDKNLLLLGVEFEDEISEDVTNSNNNNETLHSLDSVENMVEKFNQQSTNAKEYMFYQMKAVHDENLHLKEML